jgi:hypothetical protein
MPGIVAQVTGRWSNRCVAAQVGFLTLHNTPIPVSESQRSLPPIAAFHTTRGAKAAVDMARTGSNRGWGRCDEQVDANRLQTDFRFRV